MNTLFAAIFCFCAQQKVMDVKLEKKNENHLQLQRFAYFNQVFLACHITTLVLNVFYQNV